jgi:uncharacterized protein
MPMDDLQNKHSSLINRLRSLESVLLAFSGGVDSAFLAKVAFDTLGSLAVAVTATSSTYPQRELIEAQRLAEIIGIRHIIIQSEELDIPGFSDNPPQRCYFCKGELFAKLSAKAKELNLRHVIDGSNVDDLGDYRPGVLAAKEWGVRSPLKEVGLTKSDIRILSRRLDLPTWSKPALACLSSRFPYGEKITEEKLRRVEAAEEFLMTLGFRQLRVRSHGDIARIEVAKEEIPLFFVDDLLEKTIKKLKTLGFLYITLDMEGYRIGSMNEGLKTYTL